MKKSTKILLITACIFLVLGIALTVTSYTLGQGDIFRNGFRMSVTGKTQGATGALVKDVFYTGDFRDLKVKSSEKSDHFSISYAHIGEYEWTQEHDFATGTLVYHCPTTALNVLAFFIPKLDDVQIETNPELENFTITNTSGDVKIKDITISGTLTIETTSGDIDLGGVTVGALHLKTTSGEIDLNDIQVEGEIVIESNSGDVDIDGITLQNADIQTNSGDVTMENITKIGNHPFYCETQSGNFHAPKDVWVSMEKLNNKHLISIRTTSGDISID